MDRAVRWWRGKNHADRISAGEHLRTVFWQRRVSHGRLALGHARTARLSVPQVHQGAREGDVGTEAQRDGSGSAGAATALIPVLVLGALPRARLPGALGPALQPACDAAGEFRIRSWRR